MLFLKRPIVWLWVLLTTLSFLLYPRYELRLSLEIQKPADQEASLYYSANKVTFTADQHRFFAGGEAVGDGYRRFETVLSTYRPIKMLRLDPGIKPGDIKIRQFALESAQRRSWTMAELQSRVRSVQQLAPLQLSASGTELLLRSTGEDPFLSFWIDQEVYGEQGWQTALQVALACALVWWALLVLGWRVHRWHLAHPWLMAGVLGALRRWGAPVSDPALIRFTPAVWVFMTSLLVVFALGVGLKLNFSSLAIWDKHYKLESHEPLVSVGEPRVIRSDEWYVHSPWVFSQAQRGMPVDNSNIGPPGAALLVAVPVKHLSMIAQPKYWGFLFLDIDRAYAWFWMTKAVGLILFGFLLFLALTRNDVVVSLAAAMGLYSSSYLQWWFSAFTPEVLTGFMAAMLGALYCIQGTRRRSIWAGALMLPLALCNLVLHLYPPHLISMAYLAVMLLTPVVWMAWSEREVQPLLKTRVWSLGFALLLFGGLAYSVVASAWPAIASMMGTSYPGHRFSLGGGLGIEEVLMGFFEFWRDGSASPNHGVNQSESARFIFLFPLGVLALAYYRFDQRLAALILAATAYGVLCLFWMTWYLPESVRMVLAHLGWSYVPANRLYLGLGVVSVLIAALTCQLMAQVGPASRVRTVLAFTLVPLLLTAAWWYLRTFDPAFYNRPRLLVSVVVVGGMAAAVILGRRWWFLAFAVASGWMTLQVNPVLSGTSVLLNKTVFTEGVVLAGQGDPKWAVFGDLKVAQGLRAQGQDVLNGIQYAPNHPIMAFFDPQAQHTSTWNRYANMGMLLAPESDAVKFELRAPDLYVMKIHPCHPAFDQAQIRFFAFANVGDPGEFACLKRVRSFASADVFFYERLR